VFDTSGCNSAVECQLPKLNVAGSIPVTRSLNFLFTDTEENELLTKETDKATVTDDETVRRNFRIHISDLPPFFVHSQQEIQYSSILAVKIFCILNLLDINP
jgi:hypothetical protein